MSIHPLVPSTAVKDYIAMEMFKYTDNLVPLTSDCMGVVGESSGEWYIEEL